MKNINWTKIGQITSWITGIILIGTSMGFVAKKDATAVCSKVEIYIPGEKVYIEKEALEELMFDGRPILGVLISELNFQNYEHRLALHPFVQKAKVYADLDGVVHIDIEQREPIVRIINLFNQDFYIDKNGYKIPLSPNYTAKILTVNGNITEPITLKIDTLSSQVLKGVFKLGLEVYKNPFWKAQIQQGFVQENGEIELVPKVGNHRIIIGTADSIEVKFRNLLEFYKTKMPLVGWNTYKTINLKYARQIVCEKTSSQNTRYDTLQIASKPIQKITAKPQKIIKPVPKAIEKIKPKQAPKTKEKILTQPKKKK